MSLSYSSKYCKKLKTELKGISHTEAKKFLFEKGYSSSSFKMPDYCSPSGFDNVNLQSLSWADGDFPKYTKTLDIITPKGNLSWRSFNLLHPYIFIQNVNELTQKENWENIIKILTEDTLVCTYSTPIFESSRYKTSTGKAILNWIQMAERDIIKDCVDYHHLIITDIENFYPSIYTHSISWAFHTKEVSKANRKNYSFLGNKIDVLFQSSRDGQTNGIPVGSLVSDLIAEVVLCDVDKELSKILRDQRLTNEVLILRFRDDFRILSKRAEIGKQVLKHLSSVLRTKYDLRLSSEKTEEFSDIIEGSFRQWMLELKKSNLLRPILNNDTSYINSLEHLKDCLVETYTIQKKYPRGRASVTILSKIADGLFNNNRSINYRSNDVPEIISLLRKLTLLREEVTPHTFIILDNLLKQVKSVREKQTILSAIRKAISGKNDQAYQLIWFYRLCLAHRPEMCENILEQNDIPLLRVVDKKYYKHDYRIFPDAHLTGQDNIELRKFLFIDRKKVKDIRAKKLGIHPSSANPFKY